MVYRCSIEVRGYELDSFGHVNHAVYISYFEHARWKMQLDEGIPVDKFNEWKTWPVIASLEVQYLKPTYLGDPLEIETQPLEQGKTQVTFSQTIFCRGTPVVKAKVRVVMVNEKGRPTALPEEMARIWRPGA